MMDNPTKKLADLIDMRDPDAVMAEVEWIAGSLPRTIDFSHISAAFKDIQRLFLGEFSGYQACNTGYHNLQHTTDCLLAMARLVHGAMIQGVAISRDNITLGLLVALSHDTGYMQDEEDTEGTGAKYTLVHIQRSIDFMTTYFTEKKFPKHFVSDGTDILNCTGLNMKIHEIRFSSAETETLGKMLGTADLLGQMADRTYLEKLLYLYHEFQEGKVPGSGSEVNFLENTVAFFKMTQKRLAEDLGGVNRFMPFHFKSRWNLDSDLYALALQRNEEHLLNILKNHKGHHREFLRRGRIVEKLEKHGL